MNTPNIAIIGAGPVGLFSVFACGMLGFRCHVFDTMPQIGGQCNLYLEKPIYDIPGFSHILAKDLIDNLSQQIMPFNPIFHLGSQVATIKQEENLWIVKNKNDVEVKADAIIIAAGIGAFLPKKPPLPNIDQFINILYQINDKSIFLNKKIVIAGGGDTAADWALELASIAESVSIIHRRPDFRCYPESRTKIQEHPKIDLMVPYQLAELEGAQENLTSVLIQNIKDQTVKKIKCDYFLPFFGLSAELGPVHEWGLGVSSNTILVEPLTMRSLRKGIFAIGDIASYPHKLKLIATGFSEAFQAAHSIRSYLYPDKAFHFEYSTTRGVKGL